MSIPLSPAARRVLVEKSDAWVPSIVTCGVKRLRKMASCKALSPCPTTAIFRSITSYASHTGQSRTTPAAIASAMRGKTGVVSIIPVDRKTLRARIVPIEVSASKPPSPEASEKTCPCITVAPYKLA